MKKVRGYIFSRSFMGERAPQHIQNIVIREYCERNNIKFLLSATEYAMENSYLILEQVLGEMSEIHGIVLYSLFQLPDETLKRQNIYEKIILQKGTLYCAVENLRANSRDDFTRLENIWRIKLSLDDCYLAKKTNL
jgi:sporadic carbohydrate cluster protein (TIGR04323 family)